jgi:hypothetical protein
LCSFLEATSRIRYWCDVCRLTVDYLAINAFLYPANTRSYLTARATPLGCYFESAECAMATTWLRLHIQDTGYSSLQVIRLSFSAARRRTSVSRRDPPGCRTQAVVTWRLVPIVSVVLMTSMIEFGST